VGTITSRRRLAIGRGRPGLQLRSDESVATAEWAELVGRARIRPATGSRPRHWWSDPRVVVPGVAAALFVAIVAVRLPGLLSSFYWYSDFPNALQLANAVFHGGWGQGLLIRSQSGLGPLWVTGLLDQVTGSLIAGMAFGALLFVATAGVMVRTAQRVIGSRRAFAVGVLCIAAPPVVAWEALSPLAHISTVLLTAAAAWQLVALSQPGRCGWPMAHLCVRAVAAAPGTAALARRHRRQRGCRRAGRGDARERKWHRCKQARRGSAVVARRHRWAPRHCFHAGPDALGWLVR
jgi:hypothetical protein